MLESEKYVYFFGAGKADGDKTYKNLLGGKGANLAEMTNLGIFVPSGFTITTKVCSYYYSNNKQYPASLQSQINSTIKKLEEVSDKKLGDGVNPLLVSVRSGAPVSMPGMMDTILNLGLNDVTVMALSKLSSNDRFAYDSYRRFIQMFGNVVKHIDHHNFEAILQNFKKKQEVEFDYQLNTENLKDIIIQYKLLYKKETTEEFPQDPIVQLQQAINAVFNSWGNSRAVTYRQINDIDAAMGTAVTVQSMVFGNLGDTSGTGVAFTRNPSNGNKSFYGEFLMNAQGEDVVAGIRTPLDILKLKDVMPSAYNDLIKTADILERHYKDVQDIEFTIENTKLYLLQTRSGKRTAFAAIRTAVDMYNEGLIDKEAAIMRISPSTLPSLLAKIFDEKEKKIAIDSNLVVAIGLPAGPGAATGCIALTAEKAVTMANGGIPSILVRMDTSPEDISGMYSAQGIVTGRGGMTSHAAVVARGMNKPCIVGCDGISIQGDTVIFTNTNGQVTKLKEGDWISIDGFIGEVINAKVKTIKSEIEQVLIEKTLDIKKSPITQAYVQIMDWADSLATLKVRSNADTPIDAKTARSYGAQGIGLCRTEHMFFGEDRIGYIRKVILNSSPKELEDALAKLQYFQTEDFKAIFKEMSGLPVTIRLLDPPLHEFLPHTEEAIKSFAKDFNMDLNYVHKRIHSLKEANPMLGHRGCRLGITYPEITKMQANAIFEAASICLKNGIGVFPEIMIPLVGHYKELEHQANIIRTVAEEIKLKYNQEVPYLLGTMIEVPRAAVTADQIAKVADFFSFGTNDLTQMGAGISRDDGQSFLPVYSELGIYKKNPFEVLDEEGVGQLMEIAINKGKQSKPNIKLGVCGEHGGDPSSILFCHKIGLHYVSCSPYRIPIARLAVAQASLLQKRGGL